MDPNACESLSAKQRECLRLVWDRLSSKEIAVKLGISKNTVDGYISEAVARLGARDRRDAARMCFGASTPDQPIGFMTSANDGLPHGVPPDRVRGDPARVAAAAPAMPPAGDRALTHAEPWRRWLPFRTGAHNELSVLARPLWIVGLAALAAVGFGAFAAGVHFVSDLFR